MSSPIREAYRTVEHGIKERIMTLRSMSLGRKGLPKPQEQLLVMMVDGRQYHGGMCDRFKGIVSSYAWCKQQGIGFRILYDYPFRLSDYLIPAEYDWTLKEGEFNTCMLDSRVFYNRSEYGRRLLRLRTRKQIHYYGNTDFLYLLNEKGGTSYVWGELFRELFKPSPILAEALDGLKKQVGGPYNASVFRFQNLLGDFPEYKFKPLPDRLQQEELIEKCVVAVKENMEERGAGMPMLVTSDSSTFLQRVSELEGVFIIPGSLVHMDGGVSSKGSADAAASSGQASDPYLKSFLDFFMIAGASHVASIGTSYMYHTQFPAYAAKVNNVPFERIVIK